jgi:hypothetical protein
LFDLLNGFHLNLLQYKWFFRDVREICEVVQAMKHLTQSLGFVVRNLRWVPYTFKSTEAVTGRLLR